MNERFRLLLLLMMEVMMNNGILKTRN